MFLTFRTIVRQFDDAMEFQFLVRDRCRHCEWKYGPTDAIASPTGYAQDKLSRN